MAFWFDDFYQSYGPLLFSVFQSCPEIFCFIWKVIEIHVKVFLGGSEGKPSPRTIRLLPKPKI